MTLIPGHPFSSVLGTALSESLAASRMRWHSAPPSERTEEMDDQEASCIHPKVTHNADSAHPCGQTSCCIPRT